MVGDIKHIVVIQSLFDEDKKTGAELYNDTIRMQIEYMQAQNIKMTHSFHNVEDKEALIEILKYYGANSPYIQGGIVIHLEIHGLENLEGLILKNRSIINWEEVSDLFREININTCNKLYVTMATCYGRYLYKGVDPKKKSPYSGYISASQEVTTGEVMEDFTLLFQSLIESSNLVKSYLELEEKGSNFYYKDSERIFEENFQSVRAKLLIDKNLKNEILKEAIEESKRAGKPIPDEEMGNYIFEKALLDIYNLHSNAFKFDC
ncbi:hypothetical protein [uncultured Flavobacterium sp.]|uniref:hypothetical protein n=1 Tax=uncultured Flavobacterium sp. TaxID=165435 RepID=UPI0025F9E9ED|nr:hypothetical protein [uncultured Flavobacterium sp.]